MGKILVTGATGFVGSHFMRELAMRGLAARGVSRTPSPGTVAIGSYEPNTNWGEYLKDVETVVHLAARAHILEETAHNPLFEFRKSNVAVTKNLAKQASRAGVRRFILVSSIGVNGGATPLGKPFTSADPPNPHGAYAQSKAEAEDAVKTVCRMTGLEYVIIRPPLMYGAGVQANFQKLIKLAARGLPSVFSGVNNKKSFLYVRNLCDLIITTLDHPRAANKIFLVGDGHDVSTNSLYRDISDALGKKFMSLPVPSIFLKGGGFLSGMSREVEQLICSLQVDFEGTRRDLEWVPPYTYFEGIDDAVKGFMKK